MSSYRKIEERYKLVEHLLRLERQAEIFQGWQKEKSSQQRNFLTLGVDKVLYKKNLFMVSVLEGSPFINNELIKNVFSRDLNDLWAFKTRISALAPNRLILGIPREIVLLEKRVFERFNISKHRTIEILCSVRRGKTRKFFSLPIEDISNGGICLKVPNTSLPYFMENEPITVHQIGGDKNKMNTEAFVVRRSVFNYSHIYRPSQIGLIFNKPIDEEVMKTLISEGQRLAG